MGGSSLSLSAPLCVYVSEKAHGFFKKGPGAASQLHLACARGDPDHEPEKALRPKTGLADVCAEFSPQRDGGRETMERKTLLLVDAGDAEMEALSLRLRQMDYHVVRAKTADAALEALADARYRVGVVVVPPELSVLDLERSLRAFRSVDPDRVPALPILAFGERPDADQRGRLRRAGVEHGLWVPIEDNTLRFQINRALAGGGPTVATRRAVRVPTNWPVSVSSAGREKPAKLYSLSARGAFLSTPRPSMVKAMVQLVLPLPEGDLRVVGEVMATNVPGNLVKQNLPIGMAVRWNEIANEDQDRIQSFVDERDQRLRL